MYAKIMMNRAIQNWPEPDMNESSKLRKWIEATKFSKILKSDQHRRNVDRLTFQTTSIRLCYWCQYTSCLNNRRLSTYKIGKKETTSRGTLDHVTRHLCATYTWKREDQIKESTNPDEEKKICEEESKRAEESRK